MMGAAYIIGALGAWLHDRRCRATDV